MPLNNVILNKALFTTKIPEVGENIKIELEGKVDDVLDKEISFNVNKLNVLPLETETGEEMPELPEEETTPPEEETAPELPEEETAPEEGEMPELPEEEVEKKKTKKKKSK